MSPIPNGTRLRFGLFEADLSAGELRKRGRKIPLQDQPFRVLSLLLQHAGELIPREEFQKALWPGDTFVEFDEGLNKAIQKLRQALDDSSENPRFIETLPRKGYRFIAPVRRTADPAVATSAKPAEANNRPAPRSPRWPLIAILAVVMLGITLTFGLRPLARLPGRSQWVQLTSFPDAVSQPALSPDGRMLAFIRGSSTFFGPGQVYVKILPDGEPAQLTNDAALKMSPAFSPDGTRIAYTTVDAQFNWDTWTVPVLGGQPQLLMKNAGALVWTGPGQVLFSEIKSGEHMAIVAAQENNAGRRDVYIPSDEEGMAHRSYISPDGKWVLLVEMDQDHLWSPCRLVSADGLSASRTVGPPDAGCTSGAWSADGTWIYITAFAGGGNHIWRHRFPDGPPEQVTSGPTEEEGIALAPDGRSLVSAVALQNSSLWVHDAKGERLVSLEGNADNPQFTPDGKKLLYRIVSEAPNEFGWYRSLGELRVADLESGRSEPLVQGVRTLNYDISLDGRRVVMETADHEGKPRIWLAWLDRSAPPTQIPNVEGGMPRFGPDGEILFHRSLRKPGMRWSNGFVFRVRPDGTGLRQAIESTVDPSWTASRDGQWIEAWLPLQSDGPSIQLAFPLDGGPALVIGPSIAWSSDGRSVTISSNIGQGVSQGRTYIVPLPPGNMFPPIPDGGFHSEQEIARLPGARRIDVVNAVVGPSPDVYAFYRATTQRNLYRIALP